MNMNRWGVMALILSSTLLLATACKTTKEDTSTGPAKTVKPGTQEDLVANVGDRVFFAYDKYDVSAEAQATLQRQSAWLAKYPNVQVTVEGHCDDRGTREYNLALGDRRANAVRDFLVGQGVNGSRIRTISYGEERPECAESTEECWAKNRRGVTVVSAGASS